MTLYLNDLKTSPKLQKLVSYDTTEENAPKRNVYP